MLRLEVGFHTVRLFVRERLVVDDDLEDAAVETERRAAGLGRGARSPRLTTTEAVYCRRALLNCLRSSLVRPAVSVAITRRVCTRSGSGAAVGLGRATRNCP